MEFFYYILFGLIAVACVALEVSNMAGNKDKNTVRGGGGGFLGSCLTTF